MCPATAFALQVSLPGQICAVLVTTLVLEGWSNRLAPDHSVLGQVRMQIVAIVLIQERDMLTCCSAQQESAASALLSRMIPGCRWSGWLQLRRRRSGPLWSVHAPSCVQ